MDNSKEKDPQIQNVLFDLGGVIFRIDWTLTNRVLDIPESFDWWNSTEYDRYERGQLSGPEFQTAIEKKYNKSWSKDLFRKALQDLILECLPGIEEILKKTKVPIYALSNTCEAHKEVFEKTQVMTYFKRVVTSFEIASRKPERTAF